MESFDSLVAQLRAAEGAGFDVSATQAGIVLNRWIKRLATISRWVKEERELGPTVVAQDLYSLPDDIIEVHDLLVGGSTAKRISRPEIFGLKSGERWLQGGPPWIVYSPAYDTTSGKEFAIYPVPDVAGTSLLGLCAVIPADLSGTQTPPFPDDFDEALLHGAQSTLCRDLDNDAQMADWHEQKALAEAEGLRRRANSRVGSGAFAIPVGNY